MEHMKEPTRPFDQCFKRLEEITKQRDKLLAALKDVKENAGNPERVYEISKAIIAKVEGVK